jgi:glycerol uptake facilitator protein
LPIVGNQFGSIRFNSPLTTRAQKVTRFSMDPFTAELIGTALLVLFGNGVVCNVVLSRTKGFNSGWLTIAAGWGLAVYIGAFCSAESSGAHLNPAVSIAMVTAGELTWDDALIYIAAQFLGASIGALFVYLMYREHFKVTDKPDPKLACFCTAPEIRNLPQALFCETLGTFVLLLPIFLMADPSLNVGGSVTLGDTTLGDTPDAVPTLGLGSLGLLPVGLLVFAIGASLGGTTGYAINPARDLGPRIVHFLLPIPGKRDSDWQYAWVPVVGPVLGGVLAALLYRWVLVPL